MINFYSLNILDRKVLYKNSYLNYFCRWLVMIQMSVFMLVLIYISGKVWVRCRERWEFHWPYRCFRCCIQSNDARDDNDDDIEADVLCYLCNKKVPSDEWNNSETGHRRYCAVRSKDNRGKSNCCWIDINIRISLECSIIS